jgi:hypothetical protein
MYYIGKEKNTMKNYYSNSIEYHNDLDAFEARMKAEQEETDIHEEAKKLLCICLEFIGDNGYCPVHGKPFTDPFEEGSDTSMASQLNDAGYGSGGVL